MPDTHLSFRLEVPFVVERGNVGFYFYFSSNFVVFDSVLDNMKNNQLVLIPVRHHLKL